MKDEVISRHTKKKKSKGMPQVNSKPKTLYERNGDSVGLRSKNPDAVQCL